MHFDALTTRFIIANAVMVFSLLGGVAVLERLKDWLNEGPTL